MTHTCTLAHLLTCSIIRSPNARKDSFPSLWRTWLGRTCPTKEASSTLRNSPCMSMTEAKPYKETTTWRSSILDFRCRNSFSSRALVQLTAYEKETDIQTPVAIWWWREEQRGANTCLQGFYFMFRSKSLCCFIAVYKRLNNNKALICKYWLEQRLDFILGLCICESTTIIKMCTLVVLTNTTQLKYALTAVLI